MAVHAGHAQIIQLFIEHGADTAISVPRLGPTSTLLHVACDAKIVDIETICLLLDGVMSDKIDARDAEVSSADKLAVASNHGANSPLLHAAQAHVLNDLRGAMPDLWCLLQGRTALYQAACGGHHKLVRTLLYYNANIHGLTNEVRLQLNTRCIAAQAVVTPMSPCLPVGCLTTALALATALSMSQQMHKEHQYLYTYT